MKVLVLGSNGMLGSRIVSVLRTRGISTCSTSRTGGLDETDIPYEVSGKNAIKLLESDCPNPDYVINAIGVIKPRIHESDMSSVRQAIQVNSEFPFELATAAQKIGARIIQIATDCVYSGAVGAYSEAAPHDPTDVYGKTKSLGEVVAENVMHIRSSIVGPEVGRSTSLWEWIRNQPFGATIGGYTTHLWNGVTTDAFGEICAVIITQDLFAAGKIHLVPADCVSKYELLRLIVHRCSRGDLTIKPQSQRPSIDRTLSTENPHQVRKLWNLSSFNKVPRIEEMISLVSIP